MRREKLRLAANLSFLAFTALRSPAFQGVEFIQKPLNFGAILILALFVLLLRRGFPPRLNVLVEGVERFA